MVKLLVSYTIYLSMIVSYWKGKLIKIKLELLIKIITHLFYCTNNYTPFLLHMSVRKLLLTNFWNLKWLEEQLYIIYIDRLIYILKKNTPHKKEWFLGKNREDNTIEICFRKIK